MGGIAQGLNKGHIVTIRPRKAKQAERKGKLTERSKVVKEVVRECVGFAPYERRMLELLKIGSSATFKRALKFAKKRLGSHKRGKQKRAQMEGVMQASVRSRRPERSEDQNGCTAPQIQ